MKPLRRHDFIYRCKCTGICGLAHPTGRCRVPDGEVIQYDELCMTWTMAAQAGPTTTTVELDENFICQRCNGYEAPKAEASTEAFQLSLF